MAYKDTFMSYTPTVNSRKLEHQYPKSLIQKRREIQHQSS